MTNEELVALIQAGDRDKLVELWDQVKRLVFKQANRWTVYAGGGATVEDLVQAGFIAVLLAVDNYDPSKAKFSTHLFQRLRAEFSAATSQNTKLSKLDPLQTSISLDAPLDDEEDATLGDFIPDPAAEAELSAVDERDRLARLHADLEDALSTLEENERRTVRARYYQGQTLEQIAVTEGTSKSNVARWEQAALRHLRHPARSRRLMVYLRAQRPNNDQTALILNNRKSAIHCSTVDSGFLILVAGNHNIFYLRYFFNIWLAQ